MERRGKIKPVRVIWAEAIGIKWMPFCPICNAMLCDNEEKCWKCGREVYYE